MASYIGLCIGLAAHEGKMHNFEVKQRWVPVAEPTTPKARQATRAYCFLACAEDSTPVELIEATIAIDQHAQNVSLIIDDAEIRNRGTHLQNHQLIRSGTLV